MFSVNTGLETFFTLNYKTIIVLEIITVQLSVEFIFGGSKKSKLWGVFRNRRLIDYMHGQLQLTVYNPGTNLHLIVWHVFSLLILSGKI